MKAELNKEITPVKEEQLFLLRPYLFKIAYSMTGQVEEAEDIVQEVYEKWLKAKKSAVENLKAYLARMVVNQSINRLNDLKAQRELYKGPWLPEPYITTEIEIDTPSIDYGLLLLLEKLNPIERAIFILRESFSEKYGSIAELTGESEANCRQLLHRAHEKVHASVPRKVDHGRHRELTIAFLAALHKQDRSELEGLLKHDIELYGDGGGKKAAALKPLFGIDKVLKFLFGVANLEEERAKTYYFKPGFFNGQPAALIYLAPHEELDSALLIDFDETGISRLFYMRNPDKLKVR